MDGGVGSFLSEKEEEGSHKGLNLGTIACLSSRWQSGQTASLLSSPHSRSQKPFNTVEQPEMLLLSDGTVQDCTSETQAQAQQSKVQLI